jgi:hypothetical protein
MGLLLLGLILLVWTDPYGRNWASHLAPFVILGAYAVIFLGIFVPDRPREGGVGDQGISPGTNFPPPLPRI